jgi:5-methylcytosine-specific restriction endonuclease McrA
LTTRKKTSKKSKTSKSSSVQTADAASLSPTTSLTLSSESAQIVNLKKGKRKSQKKAVKKLNLEHWLKQKLRRISYQYPPRKEAIKRARISRGLYRCNSCLGGFKNGEYNLDHIFPVDDPHVGFTGWSDYVARLFVDVEGWQILCTQCHNTKSAMEQNIRAQVRAEKRDEDDEDDFI